jgi:hypothetical protein
VWRPEAVQARSAADGGRSTSGREAYSSGSTAAMAPSSHCTDTGCPPKLRWYLQPTRRCTGVQTELTAARGAVLGSCTAQAYRRATFMRQPPQPSPLDRVIRGAMAAGRIWLGAGN